MRRTVDVKRPADQRSRTLRKTACNAYSWRVCLRRITGEENDGIFHAADYKRQSLQI